MLNLLTWIFGSCTACFAFLHGLQNCETSTLTISIHQLVAVRIKSCGSSQIYPNLVNQRFCPVTSVVLGKRLRLKKWIFEDTSEFCQQSVKKMYFPCPKEINLCFSTWKVLVISSVGVVTAYKIHLRTSLLLLQFCCSHYIIDTFEKAPQDIILQFFYSSQVLPTPGTSNELFYISSRVVCAAKVLLLSQIKLCNFKIRSVMWGFFLLLSWFCWGFFLMRKMASGRPSLLFRTHFLWSRMASSRLRLEQAAQQGYWGY